MQMTRYEFRGGYPMPQAAQRARDDVDLNRALFAYSFFYPTVSMEGSMAGQREAGAADNEQALLFACSPRHVLFTGNSDTPYLAAVLDLKRTGPMVVEVPAGGYLGIVNDHHFGWVHDLGIPGPDAGRGGKHLLLPPEHAGDVPDGYFVARSRTNLVLIGLRALPTDGDLRRALESLRMTKMYPLASAQHPRLIELIDCSSKQADFTALRWEGNLQYWQRLHKVIQEEPVTAELRPMYGLLTALGIEQGKPFAPDSSRRELLEHAAKAGREQLLVSGFASNRPDRFVWPDRTWEWAVLCDDANFELPSGLDIEARERWFSQAIGASPKMFLRKPGAGSLYWLGLRDDKGAYLDGGNTYKLSVPQPVPQQLFWSVTVYDSETRSQIRTEQDRAAVRSLVELKGVGQTGALDLYFGPKAPSRDEARWIRTIAGRGWFAYFRLYGPEAPAFDGSWKPSDFIAVNPA
jgi:hypothetical protein